MVKRIIQAANLFLALFLVALIIAYASIIIPVSLACFVGFILILWLYAHLVDAVYGVGSWIVRKRRDRR